MLENLNPKLYTVLHPTWAACALQPPSLPTQSYTLGQPMRYSAPHSPTSTGLSTWPHWARFATAMAQPATANPPPSHHAAPHCRCYSHGSASYGQATTLTPRRASLPLLQPWLSQLWPSHPPHSHHATPHCRRDLAWLISACSSRSHAAAAGAHDTSRDIHRATAGCSAPPSRL